MTNDLPTIDIKGKKYVLVKDRVLAFNETYPNGSIQTELISDQFSKVVVIKAIVTPDVKNPTRAFVDYSQATIGDGMVNTTSALENASTSAVGRALAYMGIGVIESIASADEINKASTQPIKSVTQEVLDTDLHAFCEVHQLEMEQKISQKTNNPYWSHKKEDGSLCFGK